MATKAAIYARVSDPRGKEERQNPETQLGPLREYCGRHGWEMGTDAKGKPCVYVDNISAVKNRSGFNAMMMDAKERYFDVVVVVKIDRIARSLQDFVHIMEDLRAHEVRFIATTQGIDTDLASPAARLQMHMIAAMAEFERELIRERVIAGQARARKEGRKHGGRDKVVVDKLKVLEIRKEGLSIREIARKLKVNRNVVFRRLKEASNEGLE